MNMIACGLLSLFLTGFVPERQIAFANFYVNDCRGTIHNSVAMSLGYNYQSESLDFGLGFYNATNQFDYTTDVSIFPLQFKKCKIGIKNIFHFKNEENIFNEYDLLAGLTLECNPAKWININPSFLYMFSASDIFPLRKYGTQWILNNTFLLSLVVKFNVADFNEFYLKAEGSEYFYFNLFGSSSFSFGTNFYITNKLLVGAEVTSRWVDLLTLASRYNGTELKLKLGLCW